jgi:hypothetical protein
VEFPGAGALGMRKKASVIWVVGCAPLIFSYFLKMSRKRERGRKKSDRFGANLNDLKIFQGIAFLGSTNFPVKFVSLFLDVEFFPFDEQTCHLIFGSWTVFFSFLLFSKFPTFFSTMKMKLS